MRDIENDRNAGKNTLVVKMGLEKAKKYHFSLLIVAMICFTVFCVINSFTIIPVLAITLVLVFHSITVKNSKEYKDFDPELKKVALSTFALSVLFWLSLFLNY